jgi:hypothetical protein
MEPVDDILIPRPKSNTRRFRTRHVLRMLAVVIMLVAMGYAGACLKLDVFGTRTQRLHDLIGISPTFILGLCLWWYAGREGAELNRPLFQTREEKAAQNAMNASRGLWLSLSILAGAFGMVSVIYGATMELHGQTLRRVLPILAQIKTPNRTLLIIGALLLVLSCVAWSLSRSGNAAKESS